MLVEVPVQIRALAGGRITAPFLISQTAVENFCGGVSLLGRRTMLQSCKYCGRIHPMGYECLQKPQKRRKNTEAQRFRDSYRWRQTRKHVNERDGHMCRLCLLAGEIVIDGLSTHHIIPLEETMEYAEAEDWCITLCDTHHEEAERGEHDREMLHRLAMAPLSIGSNPAEGV